MTAIFILLAHDQAEQLAHFLLSISSGKVQTFQLEACPMLDVSQAYWMRQELDWQTSRLLPVHLQTANSLHEVLVCHPPAGRSRRKRSRFSLRHETLLCVKGVLVLHLTLRDVKKKIPYTSICFLWSTTFCFFGPRFTTDVSLAQIV